MVQKDLNAQHLESLVDFLSEPLVTSLFAWHPNDLGSASFQPPDEWQGWWLWAGGEMHGERDHDAHASDPWMLLLRYYDSCRRISDETIAGSSLRLPEGFQTIPAPLRSLMQNASTLASPRQRGHIIYPEPGGADQTLAHTAFSSHENDHRRVDAFRGMSPKKAHEVAEMTSFIRAMTIDFPSISDIRMAVDVGAGQGYLSRALRDDCGLHVLALDYSYVQTQGAAKRDAANKPKRRPEALPNDPHEASTTRQTGHHADEAQASDAEPLRGSLTYVTAKIDANSLREATRAWIEGEGSNAVVDFSSSQIKSEQRNPVPVLFVALHACGSLTPDILRAFTAQHRASSATASWTPRAAVVVGCCYNMMRSEDFLLSRALRSSQAGSNFKLSPSHLQLAAQVPAEWMRSEETLHQARLALRKIVWRALIQDVLHPPQEASADSGMPGGPKVRVQGPHDNAVTTEERRSKRLGRLNDAAYAEWETFAHRVRAKLGLHQGTLERADRARERRIEVFHVLRCIVGPVIESLIMLDRAVWVAEELQASSHSSCCLFVAQTL
ncbi:hypothetical protein BN946_scf184771.g6 [Trametes cinnabarina]|uniref:Methyltransferase domain-containing protein n=1 Tax=Pycnoporus cinnabarinus TaxID=5643 RepID=A0A060SJH6_PYCCI|nr:hypothetical protein BN946_scf184771.g6 [Trametes cinnabarina]